MTYLRHRVSALAKHGLLFPVILFEVCLFTLLFSIVLLPRISLSFEHLLKAITGGSPNVVLIFGLRCNNSHLVLRILATGGKVRLKVVTNGIRLHFLRVFGLGCLCMVFFSLVDLFRTSSSLLPLFMNFSCSDLQLWRSSLSVEQILLTLKAWLSGIFAFQFSGCSEVL